VFKKLGIGVLVLLLAACAALKGRHAAPQKPEVTVPSLELPLPGRAYQIDVNRSELRVLVYRAGASVFWLKVPVAGFVVDDAQARGEEGADFAAAVPDDAKSGTLHNMLSAPVLDADEFPVITVNGTAAAGARASGAAELVATLAISVAGHESKIDVPFVLESDPDHLSATGSVELRQSALGLTPYSLMLGALQVQDAMTIKFRIVATPSEG
jgi:hypothetical protein